MESSGSPDLDAPTAVLRLLLLILLQFTTCVRFGDPTAADETTTISTTTISIYSYYQGGTRRG